MKSDPEKLSKFEERFKEADREENKRKKLDLYEEIGEELHEYILAVCDNRRITQIISTYKVLLQRERHHAASIPGRIEAASKDHQAVLAAMIERNPKKAEAAMRRHIAGTAKSILETYPNYY
jgi:DNA-binding GntR family transcriptional regulator